MVHLPEILAIDNDPKFLQALKMALANRYKVHTALNGAEALEVTSKASVKAILLDFDLGTETGHEVLRQINQKLDRPPVIVISGKVGLEMALGFLNLQVFGFLEKPVLVAELQGLLHKAIFGRTQAEVVLDESFEVDMTKRKVQYGGEEIYLTQIQMDIVCHFLSHKGATISRADLTKHIWGERHICRNVLDTHLLNIKKKLPPFKDNLKLIHGRGYCYGN